MHIKKRSKSKQVQKLVPPCSEGFNTVDAIYTKQNIHIIDLSEIYQYI